MKVHPDGLADVKAPMVKVVAVVEIGTVYVVVVGGVQLAGGSHAALIFTG